MSLVTLLVTLVVLAGAWALVLYLPIPESGKKIVNIIFIVLFAVIGIGVLIAVLNTLGVGDIRIPSGKG